MLQFAIQKMKKSVAVLSLVLMVVSASAQSAMAFTVTDGSGSGTLTVTPTPALNPSVLASIYTPSSSVLSNAKVTPSTFKPSNGEQTTIHFDLAVPATVWLDIMQNGTTVNRLYYNAGKHMLGGGYDTFWNGLNGGGVLVNDGTYQFVVTAQEDTTKQIYTAQDNIYVTSAPAQLPVVITTGTASPNPINPDLSQITTVNYTLNTLTNLNIEVVDGSTSIVQLSSMPLTQNAGTYPITWNGKYSNGTKVPAKTYYIRFTGSNAATLSPYVTTVPVTVDYNVGVTNAKVQYVYAENASFNPNTTTNRIHYAVDKSTTAIVKILDASNTAVRTFGSSGVTSGFDYFTSWDGRSDASGNPLVAAGNYTAKVELYNGGTLIDSKQSSPFAVNFGGTNNTAPVVTFITATPSNFNPSNSETTSINYAYTNTSGSAITTNKVEVIDGSSVVRKTFNNPATVPFTWNGRDESNSILPTGTYTVKASVANAYGTGTNQTSVYINNNGTTNNAPVVTFITASPSNFNPNNNETTVINYAYTNTSGSAITMNKVEVIDGSSVVRKTFNNPSVPFTWNGRDENNNILPTGTYTVKASVANAYGTGTNSTSVYINGSGNGTCNSGNGTPNITNVYANPATFDPNSQSTNVYYTLDRSANVTVEVLNSNSTLVRTLSDNICQNSGTNSTYTWNGRDMYNTIVNNGSYTIRVRANNGSGTDTEYTYVNVNTNGGGTNNGSIITGMYVQPEIFNPRTGETSTAYYNLNQTATVTTEIIDKNGVIIRTLVDNITRYSNNYAYSTSYGSYNYADQWNGRDRYNNIVPDNVYQFRVTARSSNGGTSDVRTAWVEVNTDGVIIGFPNGSTCAGYIDVSSNSPYCKAIQLMKDNGVFSGYTDGTFRPYQQINRAETVKVILLALGLPVNNGIVSLFSDTDSNAWYAQYLSAAKSLGIIRGYPDGTFRPNQTVNRVELLKVFLESSGVNIPYCNYAPYNDTPVNADTRWYIDYACFAKTNGLMHDDGTGRFSPAAPMTRGDVADLFYQFENKGLYNKNVNPYYNGTYNNYNNNNGTTGYPVVSNVYVSPTTFNPSNGESTTVYYSLSQNSASSVRVQILDSNGTIRRTLSNGSTYTGSNNSVVWNGRDDSGNTLSNGTYTVRVTADNGYGTGSNSTTVYLNGNGGSTYGNPVITNVYATPVSFRAYNNESTTIYYTLGQNPTNSVYVQFVDSNGTVRRTIYNGGTSYGTSTVVWNGRDDNGNVVPSSTYTAKVVATNSYGTTTNTTTVTVY